MNIRRIVQDNSHATMEKAITVQIVNFFLNKNPI